MRTVTMTRLASAAFALGLLPLACGGPKDAGVDRATPAPATTGEADKPEIVLRPLEGEGGAETPSTPPTPPEPGEIPKLPDASKIDTPAIDHSTQLWKDPLQLTATAVAEDAIYLVTHPGPENQGKIWRVPFEGGEPTLVKDGLGRIDDIHVDGDDLFWLERALQPGKPYGVRTMPRAGGEPKTLYDGKLLAHGLRVSGDSIFWVLPVKEQGRKGGLAKLPRAGGEVQELHTEVGPTFAPIEFGDRFYFMAHQPSEPDVLYSMDAAGGDLQKHHSGPRGIISLAVAESHLYFLQLGPEGRSCMLQRVPRTPGIAKPETLWTNEERIYDRLLVSDGKAWLSTSPADPTGHVAVGPVDAKKVPDTWVEAPRVWRVMGGGDTPVLWYYERVVEDVLLREIGRLDVPKK